MINKVDIKFKDNSILKGQISNFSPIKPNFHLEQSEGGAIEIHRVFNDRIVYTYGRSDGHFIFAAMNIECARG